MCGTCHKVIYQVPKNWNAPEPSIQHPQPSPTPQPYRSDDTAVIDLDHKSTYCTCGSVFCYDCRPPLDHYNKPIARQESTEKQRSSIKCHFCKSHADAMDLNSKVC